VVCVIKEDCVEVYDGLTNFKINKEDLIPIILTQKIVFLDLNNYGGYLIDNLLKNKITIKQTIIFNLKFYVICADSTTLKCYTNFELQDDSAEEIFKKISVLDEDLIKYLGGSICSLKINSLGGLGMAFLKKFCGKKAFLKLNDALENKIRKAFYGGRKELYSTGTYENI
jgi:hypothetical protein